MRHADLGDFLLSQKSVELFKRYQTDTAAAGQALDWSSYLEESLGALGRFFDDMKSAAKMDLGADRTWLAAIWPFWKAFPRS
jgi:hypothetical protein